MNNEKMTLKQKLVNFLLKKDDLVAIPKVWQEEYVRLAGAKVKNAEAMDAIISEYNKLLYDYYSIMSVRDLKEVLKEAKVKFKANCEKEVLVALAYEEFKIFYEE